ncbi:LLM class flavin-dependent oxidoreductase [Acinetobacter puyangensis]|uniref:Alkanesulfonate monooxygenase n=1 Tax=Acinetobacter puyangensis TaxID=1096779 RepID=A0A240ECR4_9GAMM|nr:LLM class flavin-dependent oxidoreductase [Acinetobacter puyangensis]SNX45695.1 alkanesulfonate monooxygenase [Acinetobacter puyangensis]
MSVEFLWRIPVHGDGRRAHTAHSRGEWNQLQPGQTPKRVAPQFNDAKFAYYDYIEQVAKAADIVGFHGALIPAFPHTEEPWVLASALARQTKNLRLLIAIQPWFINPAYASQMAASLQRLSNGRVEWNVISGGGGSQQKSYGDFINHDQRYARTSEFLEFVKGYSHHAPFDYDGNFFRVEQGGLHYPMNQYPLPRLWLAGASEAALHVAGQHADIHLTWAEPVAQQKQVIEHAKAFFAQYYPDKKVRFGIRIDILARPTYEQAVQELKQMHESVDLQQQGFARGDSESVGAKRQKALSEGKQFDDLFISANFWAGMSNVRGGPNGILVGSYEQVAERLQAYIEIGVEHFILASNPHLEEAYRVGEEVLPLLKSVP